MKSLSRRTVKEQDSGAALVAEMVRQASKTYAKFAANLAGRPGSEEADRAGAETIRKLGATFSSWLAGVNQVVEEETVDLKGQPFPPPAGVVTALQALSYNYALMSQVQNYEHLMNQPLIPWPEIEAELDKPECREWMKTALAAYPEPRAGEAVESR